MSRRTGAKMVLVGCMLLVMNQNVEYIRAFSVHKLVSHPIRRSNTLNGVKTPDRMEETKTVLMDLSESPTNATDCTQYPSTLPITKSVVTIALILFILSAFPVFGVDHPADYEHLGIPTVPSLDIRYFISGGLSAAASHGITTPIDVVKTRIQSEPERFKSMSLLESASEIVSVAGLGALLGGLGPTVVGYGLEGAAKFGLYESLKPVVAGLIPSESMTLPFLIASVVAGGVASVMLCPMEQTRIRLVTEPKFATGLLTGIPKLVEESGVTSLFSGLPAMLSKQVPYTFAKQVSFDVFAGFLYSVAGNAGLSPPSVKFEVSFGAAFLASILATIVSHPGDVVLTYTYKNKSSDEDLGFANVVSKLYTKNGLNAFFAGITARFLHVGAIITCQLVLYDTIKQALGLPATGAS